MYQKTCVRCQEKISDKFKICPHCNMPNKIPITKSESLCPKCGSGLQTKTHKKVVLDVCPSCSGVWVDTLDFEYLTSPKDVYSDPSVEPTFVYDPPKGTGTLHECVRCDNLMNHVNFKNISGVLMDVCSDHGVWLDEGELTRIRTFIASGGIEKTLDIKIDKNITEIERIARKANNIEFIQRALHRWNLKRIILSGGKITE